MDVPTPNPDCPQCNELIKVVEQLQAQVKLLTERLEKVEREGKRQAAPFRKKRKPLPKKPGRKKGDDYGKHQRRAAPETIDQTYDVPLPDTCPECGDTKLEKTETLVQYQTEIPRTVIHRQFNIDAGVCCCCGCRVQGRHKLQTSDATGAAAAQFGPNVHAVIALANKELGLSHGKVRRLFQMLFELPISRSTSCRSVLRTGRRLAQAHQEVGRSVRGSPQVVGDETGWRVDGSSAWLHAFVGLTATYYEIDPTRSLEPAKRLLGMDWSAILAHDGWSIYDHFKEASHQQCLAHLFRRCETLIEQNTGGALWFPRQVKSLLKTGIEFRDRFVAGEVTEHGMQVMAGRLTMQMWELVSRPKRHTGNERLAKFLENHLDSLFTFLRHPGADATNWRGEQAIRPAVVNRKVWGGNRSWSGAAAQSRIMSVMQTCKQRLADPLVFIRNQLVSTSPLALPLPICAR